MRCDCIGTIAQGSSAPSCQASAPSDEGRRFRPDPRGKRKKKKKNEHLIENMARGECCGRRSGLCRCSSRVRGPGRQNVREGGKIIRNGAEPEGEAATSSKLDSLYSGKPIAALLRQDVTGRAEGDGYLRQAGRQESAATCCRPATTSLTSPFL